jgi:hypothetical protein
MPIARSLVRGGLALGVPLTFAFSPVIAMLVQREPVFRPEGAAVLRLMLIVFGIVAAAFAVASRRGGLDRGTSAVALPLLLVGVYPAAFAGVLSIAAVPETGFAVGYLVLCLLTASVVWRMSPLPARALHQTLAIVALVFLVFSVSVVRRLYFTGDRLSSRAVEAVSRLTEPPDFTRAPSAQPDVFHVVLDGMGRPDVLAHEYGVPAFRYVARLRELGFEVWSDRGQANYVQTQLTLASMLNMAYLDDLARVQGESSSREPLVQAIDRASVASTFKRFGYRIEMIGTGYRSNGRFNDADDCWCDELFFGEVEVAALNFTPLKVLPFAGLDHRPHYRRILQSFERLARGTATLEPRYVFAHIMVPHPPFVIGETGSFINPGRLLNGGDGSFFPGTDNEYRTRYRAQAVFALSRTLQAVTNILDHARNSGRQTTIIIQGDHGPRLGFDARNPQPLDVSQSLPILLAIRWPSRFSAEGNFPQSPVNIYRAFFRVVMGMELQLLPDRSFLSGFVKPYVLQSVSAVAAK